MGEIGLIVSPSVWNVIKFVVCSLVLIPILEFLVHALTQSKATLDVLRGRSVAFRDTRLGMFSLHATCWGPKRNRFLLLITGTVVIAIELVLEFSFSSMPRTVTTSKRVWMQPAHRQRYKFWNTSQLHLGNEPVQFPIDAADSNCALQGDFILRRNETFGAGQVRKLQYFLSGNYTMRSLYLDASDNETVLCNAERVRKSAQFLVPFVSSVKQGDNRGEGVDFFEDNSDYLRENPEYSAVALQVARQPDFVVVDVAIELYVGRNSLCLRDIKHRVKGDLVIYLCGLRGKTSFSFAVGSKEGFEYDPANERRDVLVHQVVMEMFGDAFKPLREEKERQIRFLIVLLFFLHDWHILSPAGLGKLRKSALEQIHKTALLVANEDGVAGLRNSWQLKEVYDGETEMASLKILGIIPGSSILLFIVVLATCNIFLRKRVASAQSQTGNHTVEISQQWLRNQVLRDINDICQLRFSEQRVAYRLVRTNPFQEPRLQLLPTFVDSCEY